MHHLKEIFTIDTFYLNECVRKAQMCVFDSFFSLPTFVIEH